MNRPQASSWVEIVKNIRPDSSHGQRAPYKALLLLWMISRVTNGGSSSVTFREAEPHLVEFMCGYVLGQRLRVEYPFVYLASSSDLWQVKNRIGDDIYQMTKPIPPRRKQPARETRSFLLEEAVGSLTPEFVTALTDDRVRSSVVNELLSMQLPESSHIEVLETVDLARKVTYQARWRDPKFTSDVREAYDGECAFCGFDIKLNGSPIALECAHIQWHAREGPDHVENGLLLCSLHHRLFDAGALGIDDRRNILVSSKATGDSEYASNSLEELAGTQVRKPVEGYQAPRPDFIKWHRKEVFVK